MFSSLHTHLHTNGLPPLTITHRIGLFVLHVVTGGEYESSCRDLEAVVPLGVGVCIRPGRFLVRTSDIPSDVTLRSHLPLTLNLAGLDRFRQDS
jgi:hypothetical protein